MHASQLLGEFVLLVAMAAAGVALFERLRLPAIAGFLITGALLGPGGFGLVSDPEAVRTIAEFGVVFLLFSIGLELPIERLRAGWRAALAAGGLQVLLTLAAGSAGAAALGLPWRAAVVVGALLAMSSTALVMRLLADRGEVDAPHGQTAVGILLLQDLCIVPFLLAVPLLAREGPPSPLPILVTVARSVLALGGLFAVARFALPWVLDRVAGLRSRDLFSLVAVLVVLGAAVAAERVGLTLAVGAFLAGLALSSSTYGDQLFVELITLRGVLLGVFFTAVGMLLDVQTALANAEGVLLFTLAAVPGKVLVVFGVLAGFLGQGVRASLLAAIALAQTGEFTFVLASAAAAAGLLDAELGQTVVAGSILSLLATPFLMRIGPGLAARLAGGIPARGRDAEGDGSQQDHVILVGFGLVGRNLARVLGAIGQRTVAVDANPRSVREARARGLEVVYGDALRAGILERMGVERARAIVVAITDPVATRQVVALVRSLNPRATILARARYVLEVDPLAAAGADVVVAEEVEGTLDMVSEVLRIFGIPAGAIERFVAELRDEGYELLRAHEEAALDPWLLELLEQVSTEWLDVPESLTGAPTLADLQIRALTAASVLAIERGGVTTPNPSPATPIEARDRLLVFGGSEAVGRVRDLLLRRGRGE